MSDGDSLVIELSRWSCSCHRRRRIGPPVLASDLPLIAPLAPPVPVSDLPLSATSVAVVGRARFYSVTNTRVANAELLGVWRARWGDLESLLPTGRLFGSGCSVKGFDTRAQAEVHWRQTRRTGSQSVVPFFSTVAGAGDAPQVIEDAGGRAGNAGGGGSRGRSR